jgi:hypothetical protein
MLMPRVSAEQLRYPASKPAFPELFKELAGDGARWADAELALARAEAGVLLRGYAAGLVVAVLCLSVMIAALVILAQASVIALMPYVNGAFSANVIVGLILVGFVLALALTARHLLARKTQPMGLIFRWLAGDARERMSK